jgi:pyruvate,water dikinase
MSGLLLPLKEANDLKIVGGKAQSLCSLLHHGFKTPEGFVVTTFAFGNMSKELEQKILNAFDELKVENVAVRSSATTEDGKKDAWAGQLDTFLNVDRSELVEKTQRCWKAIDSDRAKSYAQAKNVQVGKIAVVVQPMINAEVAGIAFSAHPVTQNRDQIVIEAGLGLGESVVSGEITPDTYIVDKDSEKILEKHISNQSKKIVRSKSGKTEWQGISDGNVQKLSDKKIIELTKIVVKLEELYGFAVDIEWLLKDSSLFIMQCRPITTL